MDSSKQRSRFHFVPVHLRLKVSRLSACCCSVVWCELYMAQSKPKFAHAVMNCVWFQSVAEPVQHFPH